MCMNEVDNYLNETTGIDEMKLIDSHMSRTRISESLGQKGNGSDSPPSQDR